MDTLERSRGGGGDDAGGAEGSGGHLCAPPVCAASFPVFSAKFPEVRITDMSVLEDLTQMALGEKREAERVEGGLGGGVGERERERSDSCCTVCGVCGTQRHRTLHVV
jgi:hypothetical protein